MKRVEETRHLTRNVPPKNRRFPWLILAMAALLLTGGCAAVGPNYKAPDLAAPEQWNAELENGLDQDETDPETIARWWTTLEDPVLSSLVERAVAGNLDLKLAKERVREARALRGVSDARLYPTVDTTGSFKRSRSSENSGGGQVGELYNAGFDAGWEIDLFGGIRRDIEAADASLAAQEEDLGNVLVTLLAEVARNYVEARTFQSRLSVAEANLAAQQSTYDLIHSRFTAGLSDELATRQARYNLEDTRSGIPTLRTGLEAAKNRLAVLTGQAPGAVHEALAERRPIPVTPATVAVGVPAETLRRRPDIRRAERQLAAETARVGKATADLYPKLRLAGSIGLESLSSGNLVDAASRLWSIGPSISWNLFDAGTIRRNIEAQSAREAQAKVQYETALLTALEEVENALTAYVEEQVRRESLVAATEAASEANRLSQERYKAGLVDFSNVLDAQRSLLSFEDRLAQSDGAVTANLIALYKALGGGWTAMTPEEAKEG